MGSVLKSAARGMVAGTVATVVMSGVMLAGRRRGETGTLPPERITAWTMDRIGWHRRDRETQDAMATVLHLGFGALSGALYATVARRVAGFLPRWLRGPAFATGVWATSYLGWVPTLGIMPPAHKDRRGRRRTMLLAHWVYGATLSLLA